MMRFGGSRPQIFQENSLENTQNAQSDETTDEL